MKGINTKKLLRLTTVLILLVVLLAGCFGNKEPEETIHNLPSETSGTSEPTDTTEEPTQAPAETDPPKTTVMGTVNTELLNVRTIPSTDAPIAGQLNKGTQVEILERTTVDGVEFGRTEVGWVRMDFILIEGEQDNTPEETSEPTEAPAANNNTNTNNNTSTSTSGTKGTVTAGSLHIRKGAGTSYESVGEYTKGDTVTILETKDNWGRTDKGWISLKYVKLDGTTSSSSSSKDTSTDTLVTDGKTKVLGYVEIDVGALYVRLGPNKSYKDVGKVYDGEKYAYYQEKNGWVRIENGWISLAYTTSASSGSSSSSGSSGSSNTSSTTIESDGKTTVLGYAVVKSGLNVRSGPGTSNEKLDTVSAGTRVAYYQKSGNWIRTKDGWISANYCYIEGEKGENGCSGTVTGDSLNVRQGPGTGYDSIAKLNKGDKVTILETITVGKTTWGYTGKGWISMDFVDKD